MAIEKKIDSIVKKTGLDALNIAKTSAETTNMHGDITGRLRSSWQSTTKNGSEATFEGTLSNSMDYASHVEDGTNRKVPAKMLETAVKQAENYIDNTLESQIDNVIEEMFKI